VTGIGEIGAIETNIFRFSLKKGYLKCNNIDHSEFCRRMREKKGILMNPSFANDAIRIVTHGDVNRKQMEQVIKAFKEL
jgi:hypothetical protein